MSLPGFENNSTKFILVIYAACKNSLGEAGQEL